MITTRLSCVRLCRSGLRDKYTYYIIRNLHQINCTSLKELRSPVADDHVKHVAQGAKELPRRARPSSYQRLDDAVEYSYSCRRTKMYEPGSRPRRCVGAGVGPVGADLKFSMIY